MVSTAWGRMSVAITRAPSLAASTAATPSPPPISSTRSPGRTARWRQKKSEPALGDWTWSGTRKRQPRQEKRSVPASLLAKDASEVEAERLLELGPGAGRGLGVLEHVDVDLERHALALDAVELGREPTALVRFGEDELRALERAVVLRELLHRLDDDALDLLGFRRGNRRERRRQLDLCHGLGFLVTGCGRRTERVEPGLEPAPSDPHADGLGEVQGCVRLLPGRDALTEPAERRQRLVSDPRIDEHLGALGVQARRLDRLLKITAAVDERALARRDRVRAPGLGVEPDHAVVEENAGAGHHDHRAEERDRRVSQRDHVPAAVDDADVGRTISARGGGPEGIDRLAAAASPGRPAGELRGDLARVCLG